MPQGCRRGDVENHRRPPGDRLSGGDKTGAGSLKLLDLAGVRCAWASIYGKGEKLPERRQRLTGFIQGGTEVEGKGAGVGGFGCNAKILGPIKVRVGLEFEII